jgi:phosphoglycolate phosphatase
MNLIFDLDGTLIDSATGIHNSLEQTVRQVFPDTDPRTLELKVGPPLRVVMSRALEGVTEQDLNKLEVVFDRVYAREGWKTSVLYPKVRETLEELRLRDTHIFLVTNKSSLPTSRILSNLELTPFFLDVICPDSRIPPFSDKAESLQFLLDKYHLFAEDTIYIGDTIEDLSSAKACGVAFIGFQYGYGTFHDTDDTLCLLKSFTELLETNIVQSHLR